MNNKEFVNELSSRVNRTVPETVKLIEDFEALLISHLEENDSIVVTGFGTFEVKKKMERIAVQPVSGKRFLVPPKLTLAFKQSPTLKEKFNEAGTSISEETDNETDNQQQ